jgi:hypothetical protein
MVVWYKNIKDQRIFAVNQDNKPKFFALGYMVMI